MDDGKEEENNNENNASSWWSSSLGNWLQSAREKSSNALEFMKRDLTEFKQVVQADAVAAVSSTAAMLKDKLSVETAEAMAQKAQQSLTSVLGTLTDVFVPQKAIEEGELMMIQNSELVPLDWWQTQVYMIRKDPKTFCHEPEGPPEMYESWLESFDINDYEEEMTSIMMTYPSVQDFYDKLVPKSVSHLEFWRRYFYRVHLLQKAEAKRAELIQKAETVCIQDIEWEKDAKLVKSACKQLSEKCGVRQVTAEINTQNLECSGLMPGASIKAQSIPQVSQTHFDNESAINSARVPGSAFPVAKRNLSENELTSADSADESRSSPVESLGKDYSTGDEWEKDFEAEINELKNQAKSNQELSKEDEDEWEKFQ